MSAFQRTRLSDDAPVGDPGPVPPELVGLTDEQLADLPACLEPLTLARLGLEDTGFVRVGPPDPTTPRWIHKAIFKRRFTQDERLAIRAAEMDATVPIEARAVLMDFRDLLDSTDLVYLDDPDLIAGLAFLVSLGLLGQLRPAQIRE